MAAEGDVVEVQEILFSSLRNHLHDRGVMEGARIECLAKDDRGVDIRLPDGRGTRIEKDYAWFVAVRPIQERRHLRLRELQEGV